MKKILFIASIFFACAACSDKIDVNYRVDTAIYIPMHGLHEITISAEEPVYRLGIYKAGYNNAVYDVSAYIEPEEIMVWNAANKSALRMLPASCWELTDGDVQLSGDGHQQYVTITFDPELVPSEEGFVLPVKIACPADKGVVNPEFAVALLQVTVL